MKKMLITGGVGSGKTFTAIKKAKELGSFAFLSPTALLAGEAYKKYADKEKDNYNAKGVVIKGCEQGNLFTTYGGQPKNTEKFINYATVIIDESHWSFNFEDKLLQISNLINNFGGNIILVTATQNFHLPEGFEQINLPSKTSFKKKKIEYWQAVERAAAGVKTLVICQAIHQMDDVVDDILEENSDVKLDCISRNNTELEIWQAITKFQKGEITTLIATNIAAQGINLPCENLIIIDYNDYSSEEDLIQKLGRLGRFGLTNKNHELTYATIDCEVDAELNLERLSSLNLEIFHYSNKNNGYFRQKETLKRLKKQRKRLFNPRIAKINRFLTQSEVIEGLTNFQPESYEENQLDEADKEALITILKGA